MANLLVLNEGKPVTPPEEPVATGDLVKDHESKLAYQKAVRHQEEVERQRNYACRREVVEKWEASIETTLQQAQYAYSLLDFQRYEP